jgi:hypothetical protein
MARKAPPEVEFKWQGSSFKAVGELALILLAALVAAFGIAYLVMTNWEPFFG